MIAPAILPDILTAWKVNLGNASRVVVVAELVGATGGVGYELLQQQQLFDMAGALAWTLQLVFFVLIVQGVADADRKHRVPLSRRVGARDMRDMVTPADAGHPSRPCLESVRQARHRSRLPRGGRPRSRRPSRPDAGAARQDRLRQVDHLQHDRGADRADQRHGARQRSRSLRRFRLVPRQDGDRVPERPAAALAHRDPERRTRAGDAGDACRGAAGDRADCG